MVNSLRSQKSKAFSCINGLLMPDGNGWCFITMSFCNGCSDNYSPGNPKICKPKPKEVVAKQKIVKTKLKEAKPKALPKTKKRKAPSEQTRLF